MRHYAFHPHATSLDVISGEVVSLPEQEPEIVMGWLTSVTVASNKQPIVEWYPSFAPILEVRPKLAE